MGSAVNELWLRQVCANWLSALDIPHRHEGDSLRFTFDGVDRHLRCAVLPNPFDPEAPPICCLSITAPVNIERAEITETVDTMGGTLEEMLEELREWFPGGEIGPKRSSSWRPQL